MNRGVLRWMDPGEPEENRRQRIKRLHNRDGKRIVYTVSESTDKGAEIIDDAAVEKPAPVKPRSARETTDIVTQLYAAHMLQLRKTDPDAFRLKVRELREKTGKAYAMWNDDQLADRIAEVCRAAVGEPTVRRVYGRQGNRVGGFKA